MIQANVGSDWPAETQRNSRTGLPERWEHTIVFRMCWIQAHNSKVDIESCRLLSHHRAIDSAWLIEKKAPSPAPPT